MLSSFSFLPDSQIQPQSWRKYFLTDFWRWEKTEIRFWQNCVPFADKKSGIPWRYLKIHSHQKLFYKSHVWCSPFPVKIQVNFSRSITVSAGPWVVIGQRELALVSHWSSLAPALPLVWWLRGDSDSAEVSNWLGLFPDQLRSWLRLHSGRATSKHTQKSMIEWMCET